jgi:nucleoside-diphosphate-sugar epimerase
LAKRGYTVKAAMRSFEKGDVFEKRVVPFVGDIAYSRSAVWRHALKGVDTLIHLAARVHQKAKTRDDEFRQVNTRATSRLCQLAIEGGIRRFVFLSTAKVNGETATHPLAEKDAAEPQDPYALSKWEAEQHIQKLTAGSPCDFVILRPPLVYGPQVKANFLSLLKLVSTGVPLPMGSLHNQRSMIYVGNLVDAVVACVENPQAAGQVFMVSDGNDLSVTEWVTTMAVAMGHKPKLFSFPISGLHGLFTIMGRGEGIGKICRPLTVDTSKIRETLGWRPPFSVQEGIADTVTWFKRHYPQRRPTASE